MDISACLVIRNEETLLEKSLESLKGIADEIIIVHDGPCNDRSLIISRKFGARVFVKKFVGEAEYHRPFSYEKAKGDWILQIDADEYLPSSKKNLIRKLTGSKTCDAYSFAWPYPDEKGYIGKGPFSQTYKPCLFQKEKMYMLGLSHEYPRTYGKICRISKIQLFHPPRFDNYSLKVFKTKWRRWAAIQAEQIKNIENLPRFNMGGNNHLSKHYGYIIKHPFISGIKESFKFLLLYISRGILFSGIRSYKIAFFEICYIWLVRFYTLKFKKG